MSDIFGGMSGFDGLSGDPLTPVWQAFGGDANSSGGLLPALFPGVTNRYTSRYGTLMQSYEQRSRLQARTELRSHMLQFESERMMAAATTMLNSGSAPLSEMQRDTLHLTGSAEIQNEITALMRTQHEMMPGQPGARPLKPGQQERLAEVYNLATLQTMSQDTTLPEAEIKQATEEYEKAMNIAIGKRFADSIRAKAKSVTAVQSHYKATTGQDISAMDAASIADGITDQIGRLDGDRSAYIIDRLSGISTSLGLTPAQMQGAAARGRQMLDNFGMQGTRAGGDLAIQAGNRVSVMSDNGLFADGNETFGFGTQEEELMKAEMMGANYLHSGINRGKMAMMRLADVMGGTDKLKDGRVKSLLDRVNNQQTLTEEDYALLERPDEIISEMVVASGNSLSESRAQEMVDSDIDFREQIFLDPVGSMAGTADMQATENRRKLRDNLVAAAENFQEKNDFAAILSQDDQIKLTRAMTLELEQLNVTELKDIKGTDGGPRMRDIAKQAAIRARESGIIDYDPEQLDKIALAASLQMSDALTSTTTQKQQTSKQALLATMNRDVLRGEYRKEHVAAIMQGIEEQARVYSGETAVTGVMAMLEAANMDGNGVDMSQIGAALLSGASDETQAGLYRNNRDAIKTELDKINAGKKKMISDGNLTPEQIERMEDDIAVGQAIQQQLDEALQYDEPGKGAAAATGKATELGPGGSGSGSMQLSNVTIVIGDETVISNGKGTGKYGGKNAVPTTQVN